MSHDSSVEAVQPAATSRRPFSHGLTAVMRFLGPSLLVGLAAPAIFPPVRKAARPAAKGLVKGALTLGESMREGAATAREHLTDILAEVRAEREQESTTLSEPQDRA